MEIEAEGLISKLEMGLAALDVVDYTVMPSWTKEVVDNLAFIQAILMDPPKQFVEDGRVGKLESLASEIGSIISSFDLKDMDKDMARKLCAQLINHPLAFWVDEVESIYLKETKPWIIDFLETCDFNDLDQLFKGIKHRVEVMKTDSLGPLKHFILQIQPKVRSLSFRLTENLEPSTEMIADHKDFIESTTRLVFEAGYVILSFLVGNIPMSCCMFWLCDVLQVFDKSQEDMYPDAQSIISTILSEVQGTELNIIPVVSKTDSSEQIMEVFDSYPVVLAFHIRTWGSALSYKERRIEVLHELLDNVSYFDDNNGLVEEEHPIDMSEDELEKLVDELVKNKKYLIILEDVEDIDVFNDIRGVLPDDRNGSVVLLTTHSQQLAFQCRSGSSTSQANYLATTDEEVVVAFKRMLESLESLISGNHSSISRTDKPATATNEDAVGLKVGFKTVHESLDSVGRGKKVKIHRSNLTSQTDEPATTTNEDVLKPLDSVGQATFCKTFSEANRNLKGSTSMKKVILKLELQGDKDMQKAMRRVIGIEGVESIAVDMNDRRLTVIGDVDPVRIVAKLRKLCLTELISVGPAKEEKGKEGPVKQEPGKECIHSVCVIQ